MPWALAKNAINIKQAEVAKPATQQLVRSAVCPLAVKNDILCAKFETFIADL